jgi:50S ribosomal protein L16 3-hydroxylase
MDITKPLALLGNLSPETFMKRHWQKKPLLIRQAIPGMAPLLARGELFDLAGQEGVESRLVVQDAGRGGPRAAKKDAGKGAWKLKSGPFTRRMLPSLKEPAWTLLVQGVDLHVQAVRGLMDQFRFVPDARLDDVMISFATPGGGVGPHFDSYDVFLLQAQGTRRWTIGKQKDLSLQPGAPLKILQNFVPEQSFDLVAGDMLYLPPKWAHDGVALDECMTYSIGFRAPGRAEMARDLLQRLADEAEAELGAALYRDGDQAAISGPAEIPQGLAAFASAALRDALDKPKTVALALGESLTEPKSNVWFDSADKSGAGAGSDRGGGWLHTGIELDRRTRMLFDTDHIFINGEGFAASGRDAQLMRRLANERMLDGAACTRASEGAKSLLQDWMQAGWIHGRQHG